MFTNCNNNMGISAPTSKVALKYIRRSFRYDKTFRRTYFQDLRRSSVIIIIICIINIILNCNDLPRRGRLKFWVNCPYNKYNKYGGAY